MKHLSFFVLAVTIAAMPATTFGWIRIYGEEDKSEEGLSVQQTSDGGYIAAGYTRPQGNFETEDLWLLKTDENGDTVWTRTYGGEFDDAGSCVRQTSDGGYIITGSTASYSIDTTCELWLIKTDVDGEEIWSHRYAGPPGIGECVEETDDGGYIITGCPWTLMKTDSQGDTLWTRSYQSLPRGNYVKQTSDGGYIVTGESEYSEGDAMSYLALLKTDPVGDSVWFRSYDTMLWHEGNCVRQTSDGGYIVTGWAGNEMGGFTFGTGLWVIKTDELGDTLWTFLSQSEMWDKGFCVEQTFDGGYIVAGTRQLGYNFTDLWLLKFNGNGDTVWSRLYLLYDYNDFGYWVQQTADSGYILTGYTSDDSSVDLWLIKTDEEGYAYHYEVSPTTIVSPQEGDTLHRMTPAAYFTNLGDDPVSEFYCHCEISTLSYHTVPYHDSVLVEDTLAQEDSVLVEFEEWTCEDSLSYEATFYATKETSQPWSSEPASVGFQGKPFSGIVGEDARGPYWEIASASSSEILLCYSGYPEGFRAFIFDAVGRKVDELHSNQTSGTFTWGRDQSSGVYFIVPRIGVESPRKVILIR